MLNLLSLVNEIIKEDTTEVAQAAGGVKTDAQAAVSADTMSLTDKNTLTHAEVSDHLKAADAAAEEVETVTFGLETDEGDIIKVYVSLADADTFEKALSKKLGEEDDIEQVLDELADQFDIVDVQWPEEEEAASDTFAADNEEEEEVVHDIEQDQPAEEDDEDAVDDLNAEIGDDTSSSDDASEEDGEEKKGGLDKGDASPLDDTEEDGEEKKGGLAKDDEESPLDTEEDEEEESPLEDEDANDEDESPLEDEEPKKGGLHKKKKDGDKMDKKGGLKKESVEKSLLKDLLVEDAQGSGVVFADPDISRLYSEVPSRQQKLIVQMLSVLGVPGDILKLRHSKFKRNLHTAGEMVLENTHLRIWMKKFVDAASTIDANKVDAGNIASSSHDSRVDARTAEFVAKSETHTAESTLMRSIIGVVLNEKEELGAESGDVEDIIKIQIHNRIAAIALLVIAKLGVDDEIVRSRRYSIKRGIAQAAKRIAKSTRAKVALLMVAGALGISKDPHASQIILPKEKDEVDEDVIIGSDAIIPDAENVHTDDATLGKTMYAQAVHKLVIALGIPEEQFDFHNTALRAAINMKKNSIKHMSKVMSRINQLVDALGEVDEDFDETDDITKAELMAGRRKEADDNAPADLGDWDIAKLDGTVVLKIEDFKIEIEIGEDGTEKLLDAIADGDITSIKCDGKRVTFRPTNRAKDYVVKIFGNTKYPNGVLLGQDSIDQLADVIGD